MTKRLPYLAGIIAAEQMAEEHNYDSNKLAEYMDAHSMFVDIFDSGFAAYIRHKHLTEQQQEQL